MSDRSDEKERLYKEVLGSGKDRSINRKDVEEKITLTTDPVRPAPKKPGVLDGAADRTNDLLKSADNAFEQMRKILQGQSKELEDMARDNGFNEDDMARMQQEIARDYGVNATDVANHDKPLRTEFDSSEVFGNVYKDLDEAIVGQEEALRSFCAAFRRPYVMGVEEGKAKNVILVTGPRGSGRHTCVSTIAKSLCDQDVIESPEVYTLDMSLYSSSASEQVFLQDLYKVLSGKGSVICFENFEVGFPAFLRMIDSLVCKGRVQLSKRYVLNKGILIENQTGLVKETVDSLSAGGKYLVFLTEKGIKSVQNAFGAEFLYHVLDTITFTSMSTEDAKELTHRKSEELIAKCAQQLHLSLTVQPKAEEWVATHFDKTNGADAIGSLFQDFYILISQYVLAHDPAKGTLCTIGVPEDVPVALIENETIRLIRSKTSEEEILQVNKELDEIVGLDEVKNYIRSLQSHIQVQNMRKEQGLKVTEISKHMIFTGNPGTGKTTIARLISRYMKAIGALSQGQLVEVTRADLVAQYVGQTAPLTMSVIKSALGGVLFIDEAYSLYRGKDDSFGLECIDTLVKAMEDNRDNLIVILAGYKREMSGFLESNSGLKSRFPNLIHFPDYTGEQLMKIARIQASSKGYKILLEADAPLTEYFDKVQSINAAEAGNGRLARNVVEDAILKQSQRIMKDGGAMDELMAQDFDYTVKVKPAKEETEFGF